MGQTQSRQDGNKSNLNSTTVQNILKVINVTNEKAQIHPANVQDAWKNQASKELLSTLIKILFHDNSTIRASHFIELYRNIIEVSMDESAHTILKICKIGGGDLNRKLEKFFIALFETLEIILQYTDDYKSWVHLNSQFADSDKLQNFCDFVLFEFTEEMTDDLFSSWYSSSKYAFHTTSYVFKSLYNTLGANDFFIPRIEPSNIKGEPRTVLTLNDVIFLNSNLPAECRRIWSLLYESSCSGHSWHLLCQAVIQQGPTIVIIQDDKDAIFGGFASMSWTFKPSFYGTNQSFLFVLDPRKDIFEPSGHNNNFQYCNSGASTIPNGMGWGGQFGYWGLFISDDFGKGYVSKSCSTFQNYDMGLRDHFTIKKLEIWRVGDKPSSLDRPTTRSPRQDDTLATFMEMAGYELHSKHIKEEKSADEKKSLLMESNDS